jgi:hypothetical protein
MDIGAIVPTFGPDREDPPRIDALVRAYFELSFFRAKYLAEPDGYAGWGGETGLYRSSSSPVGRPVVAVPAVNNSLVSFECTPFSFHSFVTNPYAERNCLVMWLHRSRNDVIDRWGEQSIVSW